MARRKQQYAEGMEPPRDPELDTAAESYVSARNKRMKLTDKEVEARDQLGNLMKERKLTIYKTEHGEVVRVIPGKDKVKVEAAETPDGTAIDD